MMAAYQLFPSNVSHSQGSCRMVQRGVLKTETSLTRNATARDDGED
jgi:hypothetical protein